MEIFVRGQAVKITYQGRTEPGVVLLASPNGLALVLEFEAVLGGYVGTMPVLWDERASAFLDLITRCTVRIEAKWA
jgi:hypothetical protein